MNTAYKMPLSFLSFKFNTWPYKAI
jgi:hypothetical protein